jgi:uncharacterized C2H2 Zn-finger protein
MTIKKEIQDAPQETCFVITKTQTIDEQNNVEGECTKELIIVESGTNQCFRQELDPCSKNFRYKATDCFVNLRKDSQGRSFFSCSKCDSQFKVEADANLHVQKYGVNACCQNFVCQECNIVFSSEKLFNRHENFHILSQIPHMLNYVECSTCLVLYSCEKDLKSHMLHHENDENYQFEPENITKLDGSEVLIDDLNAVCNHDEFNCGYCLKFGSREKIALHLVKFD